MQCRSLHVPWRVNFGLLLKIAYGRSLALLQGYPLVDNVDYVPDVVHAMDQQYGEYGSQLVAGADAGDGRRGRRHGGAVRWLVGDLTVMAGSGDGEYDLVVDKVSNAGRRRWARRAEGGGTPGIGVLRTVAAAATEGGPPCLVRDIQMQ